MQGTSQLTERDLMLMQDQLKAESRANRKSAAYAQAMTDPELKGVANMLAQHHKQRYDALYQYLNGQQG